MKKRLEQYATLVVKTNVTGVPETKVGQNLKPAISRLRKFRQIPVIGQPHIIIRSQSAKAPVKNLSSYWIEKGKSRE